MATTVYWNDNGTPTLLPLGEGGGSSTLITEVVRSVNRDSVITAGTSFTVPSYSVGSNNLQVFIDGLLAFNGASDQYQELDDTSIKFNDDIPTTTEITIIVRRLG